MYQVNKELDPQCKLDLYEQGHRKMSDNLFWFRPNIISKGFIKVDQKDGITFCDSNAKDISKRYAISKSQVMMHLFFSLDRKHLIIGKDCPVLFDAIDSKKLDLNFPKFKRGGVSGVVSLPNKTFICMYDLYFTNETMHLYHFDYNGNTLKDKSFKINEYSKVFCDSRFAYIIKSNTWELWLINLETFQIIKKLENIHDWSETYIQGIVECYFFTKIADKVIKVKFDANGDYEEINDKIEGLDFLQEYNHLQLFQKVTYKKIVSRDKEVEIELLEYIVKDKNTGNSVYKSNEYERDKIGSFKTIGYYPSTCAILSENTIGIFFNSRFQFPDSKLADYKSGYSVYAI